MLICYTGNYIISDYLKTLKIILVHNNYLNKPVPYVATAISGPGPPYL
jgi:hypothetical protein